MKPKNMFLATAKGMVLLLFMCCFVHPANAYDISGTISTEDGLPMSHGQFQVNVFVSGSGGVCENIQHLAGGVTDEVGEYSITNIAENNPTIYAQVQGGMYVPEWYAGEDVNGSPVSSPRCEDAVPIVFSNGSNNSIDFVVALGGSISGALFMSDGSTAITGQTNLGVNVWKGNNPCDAEHIMGRPINPADGTFLLNGLEPGQYYLRVFNNGDSHYIEEHWDASGQSVRNCADADPITVTVSQTASGKNFQLEQGGAIAGTLFMTDGTTPITGQPNLSVSVKKAENGISACDTEDVQGVGTLVNTTNGTFTLKGLDAGQYYLVARTNDGANYIHEFWDESGQSVRNCADADPITVTVSQTASEKNFQLEQGGAIAGTLFSTNGTTPITGQSNLGVSVMQAENGINACDAEGGQGTNINTTNGTFTLTGLESGQYYLVVWTNEDSSYISEFWDESGQSVRNCADADPITVTAGQTVSGRNFQLEQGGAITGKLFMTDGTTPITGQSNLGVRLLKAANGNDACEAEEVQGTDINSANGAFTLNGLESDQYYLVTRTEENSNYLQEFWDESGQSVRNCADADPITVTAGQTVSGRNFQLEQGGAITGKLFMTDGTTPITGQSNLGVRLLKAANGNDACEAEEVQGTDINSANGAFTLNGLESDQYYLVTRTEENSNYLQEFWDESGQSVRNCADADPITVTAGQTVSGRNFQLEQGGSISGTLFISDGSTAITGQTNLGVNVWKGNNPCDAEHIMGRPINPADGTFLLNGLEPGQYYLRVFNNGDSHYIEEHWDASGQSVRNCADADPITVTVSQTASGKNFQLEQGGSISGTFYQADGTTPITGQPGLGANVWKEGSNACEAEHVKGTNLSEDGRFVLTGLEAGRYFLKAFNNGETNYVEEYWNAQGGVPDCSQAVLIEVTVGQDAGGRNFQLDLGGSISGTVSDSAGTVTSPSLGITVRKGATACTSSFVKGVMTDDEGKYTIHGVAPGEYYVKNSPGDTKYWEMYYRTPTESVRWTQCAQVLPVTIVSNSHHLQGIDFRLEENHAGDVNGDGHKNLQDLILSLRSITGHIDSEVSKAGDFDGDNKIGLLEAIYILNELTENN